MNTLLDECPRLSVLGPHLGKSDARVIPDGENVLLASDAIAKTPELRPGRTHFQIEAASICQLDGFWTRFGVADLGVSQRHGAGIGLRYPQRYPQFLWLTTDARGHLWHGNRHCDGVSGGRADCHGYARMSMLVVDHQEHDGPCGRARGSAPRVLHYSLPLGDGPVAHSLSTPASCKRWRRWFSLSP